MRKLTLTLKLNLFSAQIVSIFSRYCHILYCFHLYHAFICHFVQFCITLNEGISVKMTHIILTFILFHFHLLVFGTHNKATCTYTQRQELNNNGIVKKHIFTLCEDLSESPGLTKSTRDNSTKGAEYWMQQDLCSVWTVVRVFRTLRLPNNHVYRLKPNRHSSADDSNSAVFKFTSSQVLL